MSGEVWMWVHLIYGVSQIVQKYINPKQTTSITSLIPKMVDWIDKTMNVSDAWLILVHRKYGTSRILQRMYPVEINNWSYLAVTDSGRFNVSDVVWMLIHCNYRMIQIVQKMYLKTVLTMLIPETVNWINKTMNISGEVWMGVH